LSEIPVARAVATIILLLKILKTFSPVWLRRVKGCRRQIHMVKL
jgi:hypothetical protein